MYSNMSLSHSLSQQKVFHFYISILIHFMSLYLEVKVEAQGYIERSKFKAQGYRSRPNLEEAKLISHIHVSILK